MGTIKSYQHARTYILEVLGDVRLDLVGQVELENLKIKMLETLEISSAKIYMSKLEKMLRWSMARGLIPRGLLPQVEWDRQKKKDVAVYSPEDLERMINLAPDLYTRVLLLLCADGCLRIGECAGLMWTDVKVGYMTISRNVCGGVLQESAKGEDGDVPTSPRLERALEELRNRGEHPVFVLPRRAHRRRPRSATPRPIGDWSDERSLARLVTSMEVAAGCEPWGPHRIRHSRLSHLAERGVPLRSLQHLARHVSQAVTERYYIHVRRRVAAREAVDAIAAMTGPGNGPEKEAVSRRLSIVA